MIEPVREQWTRQAPTSEWQLISPAQAQRWLTECRPSYQRTISANFVDQLVAVILRGEFEPGTIQFFHTPSGVVLTDGQHRLEAIARAGRDVPLNVLRKWGTEHEAQLAYARTDRGRQRSYADCGHAIGLAGTVSLSETNARKLLSAMVPILAGFEPAQRYPETRSFDARAELAVEWAPEAQVVFERYAGLPTGWTARLTASIPLAVALVTTRYAPQAAEGFWASVGSTEFLSRTDPEQVLISWIRSNKLTSGTGHRFSRALAVAWNARVEGRQLQFVKITEESLTRPILLRATPYDGKHILLPRPTMTPVGGQE